MVTVDIVRSSFPPELFPPPGPPSQTLRERTLGLTRCASLLLRTGQSQAPHFFPKGSSAEPSLGTERAGYHADPGRASSRSMRGAGIRREHAHAPSRPRNMPGPGLVARNIPGFTAESTANRGPTPKRNSFRTLPFTLIAWRRTRGVRIRDRHPRQGLGFACKAFCGRERLPRT
jgi:hypothetical protein